MTLDNMIDTDPANRGQRGRRVLVADDNKDSAESLAMLLTIDGNEVRTAPDGLAAVDAVTGFSPDFVVLDIGMPRMNGYDAAREIRRRASNKNIVLIALTGWGQDDIKRQCDEAGFDGHLVKPADYSALKQLMADLPSPVLPEMATDGQQTSCA